MTAEERALKLMRGCVTNCQSPTPLETAIVGQIRAAERDAFRRGAEAMRGLMTTAATQIREDPINMDAVIAMARSLPLPEVTP